MSRILIIFRHRQGADGPMAVILIYSSFFTRLHGFTSFSFSNERKQAGIAAPTMPKISFDKRAGFSLWPPRHRPAAAISIYILRAQVAPADNFSLAAAAVYHYRATQAILARLIPHSRHIFLYHILMKSGTLIDYFSYVILINYTLLTTLMRHIIPAALLDIEMPRELLSPFRLCA